MRTRRATTIDTHTYTPRHPCFSLTINAGKPTAPHFWKYCSSPGSFQKQAVTGRKPRDCHAAWMPPPGHVGPSLNSSLSRGSCEELNPRLTPRPGSPSWICPSPVCQACDVGSPPAPPQELAASTAVFIDALSRAGMCNLREGGALELRGKQVKIAWRAHMRRSACSGRLEPWRRCGAHHNKLTADAGPGSAPASRGQQQECGGQRPVKTFIFFGGGPGEAVLCCPRSSLMAAGTATCPLGQRITEVLP